MQWPNLDGVFFRQVMLADFFGIVRGNGMTFLVMENGVSVRAGKPGRQGKTARRDEAVQGGRRGLQSPDEGDINQPDSVAAVLKVFGILQALTEQRTMGVSEISQRLAMPKATVYRFLQTMKTLGYVEQEQESERYGLTMRIYDLGSRALEYPELLKIADREMRILSVTCQETLHLATLVDSDAVYIHKVDSPGILNFGFRIGQHIPAHRSAAGKVMLAFTPREISDTLVSGLQFRPDWQAARCDLTDFNEGLGRICQQGYAVDMQEFDQNLCCLAVPIFDYLQNVVAGLSMALPVFRYNSVRQGEYVSMLHQTARRISGQLGCTDYPF